MIYKPVRDENGRLVIKVRRGGQHLIHDPLLNKGTAFTPEERELFGLEGLLPPKPVSLSLQVARLKENYFHKPNNIEKYIFLRALQDRNETLFYAFVREFIHDTLPVIYTPTVGEAVEKYGHIYRNARGLFITPGNVHRMDEMAGKLPTREVEVIVVTDSHGILGIGDQGVGGMAIPIGKLSLYTVAAGIHPAACLPICLDVGTDNQTLLSDELYLGLRHRRLTGDEYHAFIAKFVEGVRKNFPNALLQWEDFSKQNAFTNLERYADIHPSFNDDIQGTGAVVLSGIISALRLKREKLSRQKYAVYGAGAAGVGVARQIRSALVEDGMTGEEASRSIYLVDSQGLVTAERPKLEDYKKGLAYPENLLERWKRDNAYQFTIADVIKNGNVTVLIGLSAQKGSFDSNIVDLMLENTDRPVIFPLSNPTSKAEADPRWILKYTGGKAITASGSPFPSAMIEGKEYNIGQGNNAFIFPGVGLGALASRSRRLPPSLFTAAAHALSDCVTDENIARGSVYPKVEELFEVSHKVATAVYKAAVASGAGSRIKGEGENEAEEIRKLMWIPEYPAYVK